MATAAEYRVATEWPPPVGASLLANVASFASKLAPTGTTLLEFRDEPKKKGAECALFFASVKVA
jgi:hypothetical protein